MHVLLIPREHNRVSRRRSSGFARWAISSTSPQVANQMDIAETGYRRGHQYRRPGEASLSLQCLAAGILPGLPVDPITSLTKKGRQALSTRTPRAVTCSVEAGWCGPSNFRTSDSYFGFNISIRSIVSPCAIRLTVSASPLPDMSLRQNRDVVVAGVMKNCCAGIFSRQTSHDACLVSAQIDRRESVAGPPF